MSVTAKSYDCPSERQLSMADGHMMMDNTRPRNPIETSFAGLRHEPIPVDALDSIAQIAQRLLASVRGPFALVGLSMSGHIAHDCGVVPSAARTLKLGVSYGARPDPSRRGARVAAPRLPNLPSSPRSPQRQRSDDPQGSPAAAECLSSTFGGDFRRRWNVVLRLGFGVEGQDGFVSALRKAWRGYWIS